MLFLLLYLTTSQYYCTVKRLFEEHQKKVLLKKKYISSINKSQMNEMIIHFQLIGLTQRCYTYYSPADRAKNAVFQVWHSSANRKIHLALKQ